jgi:signal transduction histidine kinase
LKSSRLSSGWQGVISDNLHYGGFILLILLVVQTHLSERLSERTLTSSVARQQALRDVLWLNLLTQRSAVLALSSVVHKKPEIQEDALAMLKSIPNVISSKDRDVNKNLMNDIAGIEDILNARLNQEGIEAFLSKIETLGAKWNSDESSEWFELLDKNEKMVEDLKSRRNNTYVFYVIFGFYMVFLGWTTRRRKIAEYFLKRNERQARMLADSSFEGLAICKDGKITEVNQTFAKLLEIKPTDAVGKEISDFVETTNNDLQGEGFGLRIGLEPIPIEVSSKTSSIDGGELQIVALRDLSERKQAENLRFEKEAAERANRSKSMFLANMSHELRTPMHGVLSFARFGIRDGDQGKIEKLKSYFQEIFDSGSRLMQLLNDLLDLSKLEAGKMDYSMSPCDLKSVFDRVINEMSAYASERGLKITAKIDETDLMPIIDQTRIGQVIRNILSNAVKFSDPDKEISIDVLRTIDGIECRIKNRGKAIPQNELESIFDKFVQSSLTRTGAGGTGLGLAICREIISHHGGRIWAESENGANTFVFILPMNALDARLAKQGGVA